MTPWESVEANRESAHRVGNYWIGRMECDTLQGDRFSGLWLENVEGEGMAVNHGQIPEGVTPEWLDQFWKDNF
jgi:hypothetical protein